jgi:hypothetical protein
MTAFVGSKTVTSEQLHTLVTHPAIARPSSYYFLRWFHTVSGIQLTLPNNFPSPEGQLFNPDLELRWKQHGSDYDVLLLSKAAPDATLGFSPLEGKWEWCDRNTYFHDSDETKFPRGFLYPDSNGQPSSSKAIPVQQRYFFNAQTATIHFVALTIK